MNNSEYGESLGQPYEKFFYVSIGNEAGYALTGTPREAFLVIRKVCSENNRSRGIVYKTIIMDGMLSGVGAPVWMEHPEGDPGI